MPTATYTPQRWGPETRSSASRSTSDGSSWLADSARHALGLDETPQDARPRPPVGGHVHALGQLDPREGPPAPVPGGHFDVLDRERACVAARARAELGDRDGAELVGAHMLHF